MSENQLRPVRKDVAGSIPSKKASPIVQTGRVRRAGSRRQGTIAIFVLIVIGALIAAGYFMFVPRDESVVLTEYDSAIARIETLQETVEIAGTVTARSNATVTSPEQGFMDLLFVAEGDWVNESDLVARINAESLESSRVALQRVLERDQREYDRFLLQHEYTMRSLSRERDNLLDDLADAQDELAAERELLEIGSSTAAEVSAAEAVVSDIEDSIEDHDATVEETVALHELSAENYEDDIASSREELEEIDERLADTRVTAPISGRVVSLASVATTSGELISQFATLLEISDTTDPVILSEIEEQYVPSITIGQPVAADVAGVRYLAEIERIGQVASTAASGGTPTVEIDVMIPEVGELLPGTSALLEVLVGEVPEAIVLPRGPYLTSGNRRYLFVIDGDTARRVEVTYGEITDDLVQITNGIEPGDRVITSSYQAFVDQTTITLGGAE